MLEINGLETAYGQSQVLFGMELNVGKGEVVTLLGRNGMGKTTTLREHPFPRTGTPGTPLVSDCQNRPEPRSGRPSDFPEPDGTRKPGGHRVQPQPK